MIKRINITVKGVVQGVGFRPFIYQLAHDYNLFGWVLNSSRGVFIEVEGPAEALDYFIKDIEKKAPPLARIEEIKTKEIKPNGEKSFKIKKSLEEEGQFVLVSPDISICDQCRQELFKPDDRRYRYPFINCTNCGPRFTIIKDIPYDRPKTTMNIFTMCPECQSEYDNPLDRRFHAQPNACQVCGPGLSLEKDGQAISGDPIVKTIDKLKEGWIVAIKGLGGFQLACDAQNNNAVKRLRERKKRRGKPLAVMVKDIQTAKEICLVNSEEEKLLSSPQRPIVLLEKRKGQNIAEEVAPNNNYLGVMIPYTPMHYLLLRESDMILIMTSGNLSEEPIAMENEEAKERLGHIADYFLLHNRDIYSRYDDSVTRILDNERVMIRRARGYAPYPIRLPYKFPEMLAAGPELKNTFCLTKDNFAFISQHIGDLENIETLDHYEETIEIYKRLFRIQPKYIAYDIHPEYLSTKIALQQKELEKIPTQHHHAHITSCMIENNYMEDVIGIAFDGVGYGSDGKLWGGEYLICSYRDFQRAGYFKYFPLPGGEVAIKNPYRITIGLLYQIFGQEFQKIKLPFLKGIDQEEIELIIQMIDQKFNSPLSSSCGRVFDAVSALLGVRHRVYYEGQAAIELEMICAKDIKSYYSYNIIKSEDKFLIDIEPIFQEIINDLIKEKINRNAIASKFHNTIGQIILAGAIEIRKNTGLQAVALSGGVFQNAYLFLYTKKILEEAGFKCLYHHLIPTNDGCISLGQAAIAQAVISSE